MAKIKSFTVPSDQPNKSYFEEIYSDAIQRGIADVVDAERRKEIENIGIYWDFYYGEQEQYIKKYEGETDKEYLDKDKPTFNYTKLVIEEYIEGVFGQKVKSSFDKDEYNKIWTDISSAGTFFDVNSFMTKAQRIAEISKTCLIMLRYDKAANRVYFEDIRGEFIKFYPKQDDPKQIGAILIKYTYDTGKSGIDRMKDRVEIWTEDEAAIYILGKDDRTLEDSNRIWHLPENPYRDEWGRKTFPCVILNPEEDDNTFYGISNIGDIVTVNRIFNDLWMALARMVVYQSFSVLFAKTEGEIEIEIAPTRYVKSDDENADLKYVTPNAKIEDVRKVLEMLKTELLDLSKVPKHVLSGSVQASPESGYALRIKRMPIEQIWARRKNSYTPTYLDLMAKTIMFYNVHNRKASPRNKELGKRVVEFLPPDIPLNSQEQQLMDTFELQHNVITEVDLMIRKFPWLSREEAMSKIVENLEESGEIQEKRSELMPMEEEMFGGGGGGGAPGGGITPQWLDRASKESKGRSIQEKKPNENRSK